MKKTFLLVPLAIILVMSLFLVSCEDEPELKSYTVTFLLDEGDTEPFDKKTVIEGTGITDAKVPEKTGHKFLNWKTIEGNDAYELNTPVKGDLTLVAVWETNTYTVTFYNEDGTSIYSTTSANHGQQFSSVVQPTPEKTGHVLTGWSTEKGSTTAYDSSKAIEGNLKLYPIWEKGQYKVSFICGEGAENVPQAQAVEFEGKAIVPEQIPTRTGYEFSHWAASENSENAYDFDTAITKDVELYAVYETLKISVSFYNEKGDLISSSNDFEWGKDNNFPVISDKANGFDYGWLLEGETSPKTVSSFNLPYSTKEYKFHVYITTELLSISSSGSVSATDELKKSTITSLSIPYSLNGIKVTAIADNAFLECLNLTSITIPSSVTSIGSSPFKRCNKLTEINVSKKNANFESDNGVLIDVNNKKLICYPAAKSGDTYTVPNTVTTIVDNAFYKCTYLTSVIIPDSVTSIGQYAFYYFSKLTNITIPNSVTSIGQFAFYECSGLKSITIPNSVTSIGKQAFACSGLTSIAIPSSVTSMGEKAFASCSGLTNITIAEGVTSIGQYAFYNCSGLTSIAIPSSVTSIEKEAFRDCINLTGLSFSGINSLGIGYAAFMGCSGLKNIDFGNRYTTLGNYAFANCTSLTSVILKGSFTGQNLFQGCTKLESVEIKEGVTAIGDYMFYGCTSLNSVSLPNSLKIIYRHVFEGCRNLQSITLPNKVELIYTKAFAGTGLTSITIPSSVTSIDETAFYNCPSLPQIIIQKTKDAITGAPWGGDKKISNKNEVSKAFSVIWNNDVTVEY